MASTLVRTGFVRGSMTQGNGCYQHRCTNNSLEVNIFHSASLHYAYFAFFGSHCLFLVLSFLFLEWLCDFSDIHHDYHKYSSKHHDHPCDSFNIGFSIS